MGKIHYTNGNLQTEELPGSSNKKVLRDFVVLDSRDVEWKAPVDMITDGKSVPPELRALIGDPFEGVTSEAAVIHDRYCNLANSKDPIEREAARSQKDTHRIFREITLKEMKEKYSFIWRWTWQYQRAWLMFIAVRVYNRVKNPDWK